MAIPRNARGMPSHGDLVAVDGVEETQQLAVSPVGYLAVHTHLVSDPLSTKSRPTDVDLIVPFQSEIHKLAHWAV
eukprot:7782843-Pyramimonas_sp.AAC.1